jgi:DNA polymerase V
MKKLLTSFASCEQILELSLPLVASPISAGFPSPAEDHIDQSLDLNKFLIKHPAATFFVRVEGESMMGAGISSGDLIIVDRALQAKNNSIVLALVNGEFTIKRIKKTGTTVSLVPENQKYKEIEITPDMDFEIWGVVTYVIHDARL